MSKTFHNIKGFDLTFADESVELFKKKMHFDLNEAEVMNYAYPIIKKGEKNPKKISEFAENRMMEEMKDMKTGRTFRIKGIDVTFSDKAIRDYREKTLTDLNESVAKSYVLGYIKNGESDPAKLSEMAERRLYEEINDLHF